MRLGFLLSTTTLLAGMVAAQSSGRHANCTKPLFHSWHLEIDLPGRNVTVKSPLCLQVGSTVQFTFKVVNGTRPHNGTNSTQTNSNATDPTHHRRHHHHHHQRNGTHHGGRNGTRHGRNETTGGPKSFRVWLGTATDQWNTTHKNDQHYQTRPVGPPFHVFSKPCRSSMTNGTVERRNFTVRAESQPVYPKATVPVTFWATNADGGYNSSWASGNVLAATYHNSAPIYLAENCKVFDEDFKKGKIKIVSTGVPKASGHSTPHDPNHRDSKKDAKKNGRRGK